MKNMKMILGAGLAIVLMAALSGQAATTMWITDQAGGGTVSSVSIGAGASKTLYVFMNSSDNGTVAELFIGYDVSSASSQGATGSPTLNKLSVSGTTVNATLFPAIGGSTPTGVRPGCTAREASNASLGGRPYGVKVFGGYKPASVPSGNQQLCSFSLTNNMTAGQSYYVVLSDAGTGASYTTAWKKGVITNRASAALQITTPSAGSSVAGTITYTRPATVTAYALTSCVVQVVQGAVIDNHTVALSGSPQAYSFTTALTGTVNLVIAQNNATGWFGQTLSSVSLPAAAANFSINHAQNGDINMDTHVNYSDFGIFQTKFGQALSGWNNGDFDGNGQVNYTDFGKLQINFGQF